MTITEMLESRGYTVTKETTVQVTAHNPFQSMVINKELDGTLRVSTKSSTGGFSDPITLSNTNELSLWLDI